MEFLDALRGDYERLFEGWRTCPLLRLSASEIGISDEAALEHVALQVKAYVAERERVAVG